MLTWEHSTTIFYTLRERAGGGYVKSVIYRENNCLHACACARRKCSCVRRVSVKIRERNNLIKTIIYYELSPSVKVHCALIIT